MPTRIRFTTAASVYEAFDQLVRFAPAPKGDPEALAYARALAQSRQPHHAIAFLAHVLPRREAIWWGCRCVLALLGREGGGEALQLAEGWVREPAEDRRMAALSLGRSLDPASAPAHLALAVGHSGGSLLGPEHPAMAPPAQSCALSVNAAVTLGAIARGDPAACERALRDCALAGIAFAEGGDATVKLSAA